MQEPISTIGITQTGSLHVYSAADGFDALHGEWDALLDACPTHEVFLSWEWQSNWWNAFQPGELVLIAIRAGDHRLIGIAPWFIEQPSRVLRTVGCVDVTDYCDLIVHRDDRAQVYSALAQWLAGNADRFDSVSLCNIPAASPTLTEFAAALAGTLGDHGFVVESIKQEVCPVIDLPDTFDAFLDSLDKKQRHELRRKIRRAEEGEDQVEWYFVDPARHDLNAELDAFLALMAASHPDKASFLQNPQHQASFRAIVPALFSRGWGKLSFLTVNGVRAAVYLAIDYDNRIGLYNSGLLPDRFGQLSPGIVLLAYIIRDAIEQKRRVFDFLRGNEDYKYRMGAHDTEIRELIVHRQGSASPEPCACNPESPSVQH